MPSSGTSRLVPLYGCPCGQAHRHRVTVGDEWEASTGLHPRSRLRIVALDRNEAIVEQTDRPQDGRFGYSYKGLIAGFRRAPLSQEVAR